MVLTVSAPGRVTLFGEHQDYLGLPVIPAAIDLRIQITGQESQGSEFSIFLDDLGKVETFKPDEFDNLPKRAYLQTVVKIMQQEGIIPLNRAVNAQVSSDIPIQAGLSSSSALTVCWIKFLAEIFNHPLEPMEVTQLAYKAEVLEFNEPGGMMDQMIISHGFIHFEEFDPIRCTRLLDSMPGIVIGDSQEKKDTLTTLATLRGGVNDALQEVGLNYVMEVDPSKVESYVINDKFNRSCLLAAVKNFSITKKVYTEFKSKKEDFNKEYIGNLMNEHHSYLRDYLDISTSKIERMIKAANQAGALGGKITGSGNGGCMIAFAPGKEEEVSKAIQQAGGVAYSVSIAPGVGRDK